MNDLSGLPNLKHYRLVMGICILLMVLGVVLVYFEEDQLSPAFYIHVAVVTIITGLIWIYPKWHNSFIQYSLNIMIAAYFYLMFIIYPFTMSTLLLICFIPGVAFLFFNKRLFYWTLYGNIVMVLSFMLYVLFVDRGTTFHLLYADIFGYAINFFASQAILLFIHLLLQKRIENQKLYYKQIQEDARLKTTGQLAAAVAHEIRNPITVVQGFLQFYSDDQPLEKKKHYELMLEELNTAEKVISDFLSLAKPSETGTEIVNVKEALHNVMDLINTYALMDTIQVRLDVVDDCDVSCSLLEFKQLFVNIFKNAIEASKHGDSIEVKVEKEDNLVHITVSDHGVGMTDEQLQAIGTPFYSLKSKGTGLGMMICFNIVKKYGGSIFFQSKEGIGTDVTVSFPIIK
ncbi:HAMP domain-containing histidine kinase [Bacillus tianshenii]|uniref:sensor histidine kinase n=1 Tax=Sutcliffiella tianshenii TaxID=1463404 RepID=UPI001CD5B3F9|nr:HAMP domain-containing sensor histidine kinase [Bacillus tianshenii]MCA1319641.1 HAMP domain-containing histidine kinase [Bacillus tianshenii]